MMVASDCELIRAGFWGQPSNAVSSLAFVVVGVTLMRSRPVLGVAATGVGVGSFLFHGPMPPWAEWAHDVTLVALIGAIALERRTRLLTAMIGLLAAIFAYWPAAAEPTAFVVAVVAAGSVARNLWGAHPKWRTVSLALFGSGVIVQTLSRTEGPLCNPESLIQGHALWHLLAAGALLAFTRIVTSAAATD